MSEPKSSSVLGKRHALPSAEQLSEMDAKVQEAATQLREADTMLTKVRRTRNMASLDHRRHRDTHEFWRRFAELPRVVYGHPEWSQCVEVQNYRLVRFHLEGIEAIKKYYAAQRLMLPTVTEVVVPTHIDQEDLYGLIAGVHYGGTFYFGCPEHVSQIWHRLLDTAELKRQYDRVTLRNHSSYHVLDTLDVETDSNKNTRLVYDAHAVLHVWIRDDLMDPILKAHGLHYAEADRQNVWLVTSTSSSSSAPSSESPPSPSSPSPRPTSPPLHQP
jgi:hypothetical protein